MANYKILRENTTFYEGNRVEVKEISEGKWNVIISGRISHQETIDAIGLFDATNNAFKILYKEQKS